MDKYTASAPRQLRVSVHARQGEPGLLRGSAGREPWLPCVEVAVAACWRSLAIPMEEVAHAPHARLTTSATAVTLDDDWPEDGVIEMTVSVAKPSRNPFSLRMVARSANRPLADMDISLDPRAFEGIAMAIQAFERGENMVELRVGDWADLSPLAASVRKRVFVEEQAVPDELEWDLDDSRSVHAVAINRLGQPIGTGRLLPADNTGMSRLGRMAVLASLRGRGVGARILSGLIAVSSRRGDRAIRLHAQRTAEDFYRRMGFVEVGEPFTEVGIAHVAMEMIHPTRRQ